jgi:Uma2 family endonuclease
MEKLKVLNSPYPPRTALQLFNRLPEGIRCELINNAIIMSPSPTLAHQRQVMSILKSLDKYVTAKKMGEVFAGPVDVQLSSEQVFIPDIFFISKKKVAIIHNHRIVGAPDIVIEVASPGSVVVDKTIKKEAYLAAGVVEYFVIMPDGEVFRYDDTGFFKSRMITSNVLSKTFRI